MTIKYSVLISSFNRLPLLKRCLFSIAKQVASANLNGQLEVILADDGSTDDIISELRRFSSMFPWKFVRTDVNKFTEQTGVDKFFNNPSLTNNIAFEHSQGEDVFLMGNECIAWGNAFKQMLDEAHNCGSTNYLVFSDTCDVPQSILDYLDDYGANISQQMVTHCNNWFLQHHLHYHSDVTNYLSLVSRQAWEFLGGYDERYLAGIACEDSDFVRRFKLLPNAKLLRSTALSLHQFHGGKTKYYEPIESIITKERWNQGLEINRKVYHAWDGKTWTNQEGWPSGAYGVVDVIANGY